MSSHHDMTPGRHHHHHPPHIHGQKEGITIPGRDIEESVPSLLIVLLDFVLKVLKLCLFFDELFRVRMSEEHHSHKI